MNMDRFGLPRKKWAGKLKKTPAAIHSIVRVVQPRYNVFGQFTGVDEYVISRDMFEVRNSQGQG